MNLEEVGGVAITVATILGGAAALLVVAEALRRWYRRTLGRRQDRYERLARLGTLARLSFFEAVLGEPPAMTRAFESVSDEYDPAAEEMTSVRRTFRVHIFIDRDYYVQAFCADGDDTVLAFSVTTRSARFEPTFTYPPKPGWRARRRWEKATGTKFRAYFKVKLGHTRFSALGANGALRKVETGARTYSYTEAYYFGNPGNYQHFCFTTSTAAPSFPIGPIVELREAIGHEWIGGLADEERERVEQLAILKRVRHETPITTYTVLGPTLSPQAYPATFGPHGDEVRTLP